MSANEVSTLIYLDGDGHVSFLLVPWTTLNEWLSKLNGVKKSDWVLPGGLSRGKILEELEARRQKKVNMFDRVARLVMDRGRSRDWREYKNSDGLDHLEELLVYQPTEWRVQAREYLFMYQFDVKGKRCNQESRPSHEFDLLKLLKLSETENFTVRDDVSSKKEAIINVDVVMDSPIMIVLFHPDLLKTKRYEPLQFLLSYDAEDPVPSIVEKLVT